MVPGWQAWHLVLWRRPAHRLKVKPSPSRTNRVGFCFILFFCSHLQDRGDLPGCICPCITNGLVKGVLWPDKKGSRWAQAKGKCSGQHAGCINEAISPLFCPPSLFLFSLMRFSVYVCVCVCVFIPTFRREKGLWEQSFHVIKECSFLS